MRFAGPTLEIGESEMTDLVDKMGEESKAEKFKRLGNSRLNKAVYSIGLLESLAVKAAYDYTDEQVDAIMSVLVEAVANVEAAFKNGGPVECKRRFL